MPGRDLRAFSVNGPVTPGAGPCEGDHTLPSIRLRVYPRLSLTLTGACERHFSGKRLAKSILPSDTWPSASMTRTLSKLSMESTSVVGVISQQTVQNSIRSPSRASGQTVNYLKCSKTVRAEPCRHSWSLSNSQRTICVSRLTTLYFESFTCFTKRSSKNCDGLAFFASGIVSDRKSRIP